jgi:hypothetical protein
MEQIAVGTKRPHLVRRIIHFKTVQPIIAGTTLLLMVTLVIAVLVVSTLAKRLGDRPLSDPFTAFADVFPGQSPDTRVLIAQGFSCNVDLLPSPADISERCTQTLPSGMFSAINLTIWDGVVKWLDLKVRDNNLDVGNLSLQWGSPEIRIEGNWVNLRWPKQHVTGLGWSSNRRFTYFQAVSHITFAI